MGESKDFCIIYGLSNPFFIPFYCLVFTVIPYNVFLLPSFLTMCSHVDAQIRLHKSLVYVLSFSENAVILYLTSVTFIFILFLETSVEINKWKNRSSENTSFQANDFVKQGIINSTHFPMHTIDPV